MWEDSQCGIVENFDSFRNHVLLPQTGDSELLVIQSGGTETGTTEEKEAAKGGPSSGFYVRCGTGGK